MNYNRNFSLLVASMMASSAFTATVNAAGIKIAKDTTLLACKVNNVNGTLVLDPNGLETIDVSAATPSNPVRVAVKLADTSLLPSNLNTGDKEIAESTVVNGLIAKANAVVAEGQALFDKNLTFNGNEVAYTKVAVHAAEVAAEMKGVFADKANVGELKGAAIALAELSAKLEFVIGGNAIKGYKADKNFEKTFLAKAAAEESKHTAVEVLKDCPICTDGVDNTKYHVGVIMGDQLADLANATQKYKVLVSGALASGANVTADARTTRGLTLAEAVVVDDTFIGDIVDGGANRTAATPANNSAVDGTQTFIANAGRKLNDNNLPNNNPIDVVAANAGRTAVIQCTELAQKATGWANNRLQAIINAGNDNAKDKNITKAVVAQFLTNDYDVTFKAKKNAGSFVVSKSSSTVKLGSANGQNVDAMVVTFYLKPGTKEVALDGGSLQVGKASITVEGTVEKESQEISADTVGSVLESGVASGTTISEKVMKDFRSEDKNNEVTTSVKAANNVIVNLTYEKGQGVPGAFVVEQQEIANVTNALGLSKDAKGNAPVAVVVKLPVATTGKTQVTFNPAMLPQELQDLLSNTGSKLYVTSVDAEGLAKAAATSEAEASADDDEEEGEEGGSSAVATESTQEVKADDEGNYTFTYDPSKTAAGYSAFAITTEKPSGVEAEAGEEGEDEDGEEGDEEVDEEGVEDGEEGEEGAEGEAGAEGEGGVGAEGVEPEITTDEVETGNSEEVGGDDISYGAEGGSEGMGGVSFPDSVSTENTVPSTGAAASAAALAIASLAAGAAALKKNKK